MYLENICSSLSATRQILLLLLLVLAASVFSSVIALATVWLLTGSVSNISILPDAARFTQFVSASGTFLLPAILYSCLCCDSWKKSLSVNKAPGLENSFLVLIGMFAVSPFINLTAYLNRQVKLPEFMSSFEDWLINQEENAETITDLLINGGGTFPFVSNIVVIALTAAVTEEFLFRGALSNALGKYKLSRHTVIWLSAILFSAFHLQFYGFIPRMLLGAYFGYLLYWSRSIWLPVWAHFINNATAVIAMSSEYLKDKEYVTGELNDDNIAKYIPFASLMLIVFVVTCLRLKKQKESV